MRILVCLKQAIDVSQIKSDKTTGLLLLANVPRKISDFDKNALEEAIRLKEKFGGEVLTLTVGSEDPKTTVREALAIGADKAYIVADPILEEQDTLATSYVLAEAIKKIGLIDLILCGETSIDGYTALIGPRLAERLNLPVISHVRKLSVEGSDVIAERTLEDCYETVKARIPLVLTVTKELNEPRIPTLMAIMKASRKEIIVWKSADLNIPNDKVGKLGSATTVICTIAPKMERKRIVIKGETPEEIANRLTEALLQQGVIKK